MSYKQKSPLPIVEGGTNASSMTTTDGVLYFDGTRVVTTLVGNATDVLTSNGAGFAPTFQAATGGGASTFHTDGADATVAAGAITIAGGSNMNTAGAGSTVTINLNNSPSVSGSVTAGTGLATTTGDVTITAGNLLMPNTTSTAGIIEMGGSSVFNCYPSNLNVFAGPLSGNFTTTGTGNVALGAASLIGLTSGSDNVSICTGLQMCTSGDHNVGIGQQVMEFLTTGTQNVGIGARSDGAGALFLLVTGSRNIAIGGAAGAAYTTNESDNIIIGHNNLGVIGDAGVIRIGNPGTITATFIDGIFGSTVNGASGTACFVDSSGQLGTIVSSIRFKQDVKDLGTKSKDIFKLRPVSFSYKKDESGTESVGLIAEEVERVMPQMVVRDDTGLPLTVKYHDLPVLLLNEIQKQQVVIQSLLSRIEKLEGK